MEGCRNRNAFIIAILFYFYFIDRPYFSIFIFRREQVSKQSKAEHTVIPPPLSSARGGTSPNPVETSVEHETD